MERRDTAVDLGAVTAQSHFGMDGEGEVDRGSTGRQALHVAFRREDEDLVLVQIDLEELEELFGRVRVLLKLDELPEPAEVLVQLVRTASFLVDPVRGDPVLRGPVHLTGPNLDLVRLSARAEYGGMKRLVGVRLGRGDIVLDALLERGPPMVNHPQGVITVADRLHQHPHRHQVVDILDRFRPMFQFPVDRPQVFGPARDLEPCYAGTFELGLERAAQPLDHLFPFFLCGFDLLDQLLVFLGLQELEREIFEFGLDTGHAEPVGEGRVDLARLQRDPTLALGRHVLQRPHIVQPVGQLHDDHAGIAGDREEEFTVVADLLFGARAEREAGQLGQSVDDALDLVAEDVTDLADRDVGILDHVVQQRGHDRRRIHLEFHEDPSDGHGVRDEIVARKPFLPAVGRGAEPVRPLHTLQVEPVLPLAQRPAEPRIDFGEHAGHSSPASAKLK